MRNPANHEIWPFVREVVLMIGGQQAYMTLNAAALVLGINAMDVLRGFVRAPLAYAEFIAAMQLGAPRDALRELFRERR